MAAGHGNTPAAWIAVAVAMLGFVVGSVALLQTPAQMTLLWIGIIVTVLVEVHDEAEAERAQALDAELIGVNSRNLKTLEVDPGVFGRLAPQIHDDVVKVAESGITGIADVQRFVSEGASVVLVGEALVKDGDPEAAVRTMTGVTAR